MGDYRTLKVWERSQRLTLGVYESTRSFPREELFGLTGQLRRAASSIAANVAEGYGRGGDAELGRFLKIARGSASELAYHLVLARDLTHLEASRFEHLITEVQGVGRMLTTFIDRLAQKPAATSQQP